MTIRIVVDMASPVPPFEQVRSQFQRLIESQRLAEGARLPTVRALAGDLGLAAGTVARAYKELESSGYIQTARRGGSTVLPRGAVPVPAPDPAPGDAKGERADQVDAAVVTLIRAARNQGLSAEELLGRVRQAALGELES